MGWILDLVLAHHIDYAALKDGTLNLYDCALLSDAVSIKVENDIRIRAWQAAQNGGN